MSKLMENYDLLTPYGEIVFVKIKQLETPIYYDGSSISTPSLPKHFLGQIIKVQRTGSHTWQPVQPQSIKFSGYPHIYGLHVSEVYTLDTHPEYFI